MAVTAQDTAQQKKDAEYTKVITERSDKIVAKLGITDTKKYNTVKGLITKHYRDLNTIYDARDVQLKHAKANSGTDKHAADSLKKSIVTDADNKVLALHPRFLAELGKQLKPTQIDMVKDGLTYNVLEVTNTAYIAMIPALTETQKAQIMTWLIEARERSMDAESSKEKHAWFDRYKGKINNYLSAQGYNAQKERDEWYKRIKAADSIKSIKRDS